MGSGTAPGLKQARATLEALLLLLAKYGGDAGEEKRRLLTALAAAEFASAGDIVKLHRAAAFLSAFPDSLEVHAAARALCRSFGARVRQLSKTERKKLDDSGIAGSITRHSYSATASEWLTSRFPDAADIDWAAMEEPGALGDAVAPILNPMEDEAHDFSGRGFLNWLRLAKGEKSGRKESNDLVWLLAQKPAGEGPAAAQFTEAFDAAEVPLAWQIDPGKGAIAEAVLAGPITCRTQMRRASPDIRRAVREPLQSIEHLSRAEAKKLLDVWRAALWARARTVLQIERADLGACYLADLGLGLQMAVIGVLPSDRVLLEVNYGYLLMSNGMAIGYGGFTPLFAQVNTGINVFPDFRGSEAAFAWEQALRTMHTMTGCARFIINPYQLGSGNDEALKSGAYWFYYRLGFRSADPGVREVAETESARMRADRSYRVPLATLRKLSAGDVHLDVMDDAKTSFFEESYLEALGRGVAAAIAREGVANRQAALGVLTERLAATLGINLDEWTAGERNGLRLFAPVVAQITDLEDWARADKKALAAVLKSRWAPAELDFVFGMRRHDKLREALAAVARMRA